MGQRPKAIPYVAAATVSESGMPHTSQASTNAVTAPAMAERHGAMRHTASISANRIGGSEATSADSSTLPPTGLYIWLKVSVRGGSGSDYGHAGEPVKLSVR